MSSRIPEPCDVPRGEHEGELRFYITGWKCQAHRPQPRPAQPAAAPRKDTP